MAELERKYSLGMKNFPTLEEINAGFDAAEARIRRGEEVENIETIFHPPEMQAAWKALSPEKRIDILDMLIGTGAYVDERCVKHFPVLAKTDDIADFGTISEDSTCANLRDSTLRQAFDFETNTFTAEHYRRTQAENESSLRHFMGL